MGLQSDSVPPLQCHAHLGDSLCYSHCHTACSLGRVFPHASPVDWIPKQEAGHLKSV